MHGAVYYDASGTDLDTTFRIENPSNLSASSVEGNFQLEGAQHLTKWTSPVPPEWQALLGNDYIMGAGPELAILSRLSVGPSMFSVDMGNLLSAQSGDDISTSALLDFSTEYPMHDDFLNYGGASGGENNDVFNIQSKPGYGFIVPGTRTYAVLGASAGHSASSNPYVGSMTDYANLNGTIFYKNEDASWTDDRGKPADGYSVYDHDDKGAFYWFFDLNDILDADHTNEPRPYAYGHYNNFYSPEGVPSGVMNTVNSGTWDEENKRLYLSLPFVERTYDGYSRNPVIVVIDYGD